MKGRPAVKRLGGLPFTMDEFRQDILSVLSNGMKDGVVQCRYCKGFFTIAEIAADHANPLSRGGSLGLDNIDYPCINCNRAKGSMRPEVFLKLIAFLETEIPESRTDVLGRLSKAISLAVAARRSQVKDREAREKAQTFTSGPRAQQLQLEEPF
jgi:hypothetical protein